MDDTETKLYPDQRTDSSGDYSLADLLSLASESSIEFSDLKKLILIGLHLQRNPLTEWLNSYQAMKMLNICSRTLIRYRQQRLIRYTMVNGMCRYRRADIVKLLKGNSLND